MKSAHKPVRRRKATPPPGGWGVVLIDGVPLRRKARRDYEKALRDLDAAKADLERFETVDKPRFDKWMNANFGAILTEIRELQEKLFHAQGLVNEVQQEFFFGNYRSIANAYKEVLHRRAHPEMVETEERETEGEEEEFRRDFEDVFGKTEEEFWEKIGFDPNGFGKQPRAGKEHRPSEGRLKDIYRNLVRRLHPDKKSGRSKREIEWWHETQDAYQTGNLEQLELILTLVEMEDKGPQEPTVSVLSQLTVEFKKSLRSLKRKLSAFKKDIAWNFSCLADFSPITQRTRLQLEGERDHFRWLLEKYEKQIASWENSAAKPRKRVRTRRGAWQDEEWF